MSRLAESSSSARPPPPQTPTSSTQRPRASLTSFSWPAGFGSPSNSGTSRLSKFFPSRIFSDRLPEGEGWFGGKRVSYSDGSSIDWSNEYAKERLRKQALSEISGLRGILLRTWDNTTPWVVVTLTGLGTGSLAASLDILTAWLSGLRTGVCTDAWWMNRDVCCTGLDLGETCNAWKAWGDVLSSPNHLVAHSISQYFVYILLALLFALVSSFFVQVYAPYAFHTGIPEIKTILGGYVIRDFLGPETLLIKSLGLPLAVASGLSLGKEGPMVHVACCIGSLFLRPFKVLKANEARQREILSAAAAAGVSVAFGAPLGGVIFSLEEISTYFPGSTLWQSFVCAIIAAVTLQYIDPYNTGKLVLFQVTTSQVWRGFELFPWLFLGVLGGIWGAWFIRINEEWERFRRASGMNAWPVTEVAVLSVFTAVVSYLVVLMRIPSAELVENLFQDCSAGDAYGLCDTSRTWSLITVLLVTAISKTFLTAVTFGASIPAGIFLPSLVTGACVGRAVGLFMSYLQRSYPLAWIFSSCPADGACISPPVYAVIGAASALGGVTRMTISLVVIMFELTGAVDLVLQIMMAVMVSKFTADSFSKDGIYETWINLRAYPFLSNKEEYRKDEVLACDEMTTLEDTVLLSDEGWTVSRIEALLDTEDYRGFPIVRSLNDRLLLGYIARDELQYALERVQSDPILRPDTPCHFLATPPGHQIVPPALQTFSLSDAETLDTSTSGPSGGEEPYRAPSMGGGEGGKPWVNLRAWVDQTPITMHAKTPIELVLQMFSRLGLRYILFTDRGVLAGLLTKKDLHTFVHRPSATSSSSKGKGQARYDDTGGYGILGSRRARARTVGEEEEEEGALLDDMSRAGSSRPQSRSGPSGFS